MNVTVTCEVCGKQTLVSGINIKSKKGLFEDSAMLDLTYYNCNHCGKETVVCVDNEETHRLMKVLKDSVNRANNQMKVKGHVKNSTIKINEKNKKKLEKTRNALNIGYNGSFYQCGDQKLKLEISVPYTK